MANVGRFGHDLRSGMQADIMTNVSKPTEHSWLPAPLHRLDRDRVKAFVRFVWQRFVDDKCLETAGALAYTTLFALVPLTVAIFTILTALPSFNGWSHVLTDFLFRNFVPAAGEAVQKYVLQFAGNASKLTGIGVVVLLATALMMMSSIEARFNRIWRVQTRRSTLSRFMMYWAALTLGPIMVVSGLTLTSYVAALPLIGSVHGPLALKRHLLGMLPFAVSVIGLFAMYTLVPNRRVMMRYAAIGAVLVAVLFEIAKWAFATYMRSVTSYQQIYGALSAIPVFLVWIYLSWVIVLLGASLTASLSAFDYRPRANHLPEEAEFLGLMHILKHFVLAQRQGRALSEDDLRGRERYVSDDQLQRYLGDLHQSGMIQRTENEAWVMMRSLDTATLMEIYRAGRYRLPLDEDLIEQFSHGLPTPLRDHLGKLAQSMRSNLGTPLSDLFLLAPEAADEDPSLAEHRPDAT
jgi:membrane protein